MDVKIQLVKALAEELAVVLELSEDIPDAWMPESIQLLQESVTFLLQEGVEVPDPVVKVLQRSLDRAA